MKRQRNTAQIKEQTRNTEIQRNRQTTRNRVQNDDSKDHQKP